jgi:hypothetical protein
MAVCTAASRRNVEILVIQRLHHLGSKAVLCGRNWGLGGVVIKPRRKFYKCYLRLRHCYVVCQHYQQPLPCFRNHLIRLFLSHLFTFLSPLCSANVLNFYLRSPWRSIQAFQQELAQLLSSWRRLCYKSWQGAFLNRFLIIYNYNLAPGDGGFILTTQRYYRRLFLLLNTRSGSGFPSNATLVWIFIQ